MARAMEENDRRDATCRGDGRLWLGNVGIRGVTQRRRSHVTRGISVAGVNGSRVALEPNIKKLDPMITNGYGWG